MFILQQHAATRPVLSVSPGVENLAPIGWYFGEGDSLQIDTGR